MCELNKLIERGVNMKSKNGYVYIIFNKINYKVLIGEASDGYFRLSQHKSNLKKGIERNKPLQQDFNNHCNEDIFEFEVIIQTNDCELSELVLVELVSRVGKAYNDRKNNKYKEVISGQSPIPNYIYKEIEDFLHKWYEKFPYISELLEELDEMKNVGFEFKSEELYQKKFKNQYLGLNYDDVETVRVTKQLFLNSYRLEMELDKDFYDFSRKEAEAFLYSLKAKTENSLRNIIPKLSSYLNFAIEQGVSINKVNYYREISDKKSEFLDKEAEENMIFDKDEIMAMAEESDNPQDGVILSLLIDGLSPKNEFEELINLKSSDINFEDNVIKLADREIPMSDETVLIVKDALRQDTYFSIFGDKTRKYKITKGDFVLRGLRNKLQVKAQIISQRILRISEKFGYEYLNATTVSYSGQLHFAAHLINTEKLTLDEALPIILERFAMPDNSMSRHYLKNRIVKYLFNDVE